MIMLRRSSIGAELVSKVQNLVEISKISKNTEILKILSMGVPALRVIRAGTWLTVHRSLSYWCKRKPRPKSTEFIYTMDLFRYVFVDENHHDMKIVPLGKYSSCIEV